MTDRERTRNFLRSANDFVDTQYVIGNTSKTTIIWMQLTVLLVKALCHAMMAEREKILDK